MRHAYFDDFKVGQRFKTAGKTLTEADVIGFAERYDPQYFHLDVEAAKDGPFGGLIASGLHTLVTGYRMLFQAGYVAPDASLGSPGIDELRWVKPVRPGDTLHMRGEVIELKPSSSKPDRGVARFFLEVVNQRNEVVMTLRPMWLLKKRPASA
ncbi:MAG: MaoC family dehydratase [Alphaproteobacteria bacterium]|nr:MaoC family dehydratase [Alphaproteobacteria bacterium]